MNTFIDKWSRHSGIVLIAFTLIFSISSCSSFHSSTQSKKFAKRKYTSGQFRMNRGAYRSSKSESSKDNMINFGEFVDEKRNDSQIVQSQSVSIETSESLENQVLYESFSRRKEEKHTKLSSHLGADTSVPETDRVNKNTSESKTESATHPTQGSTYQKKEKQRRLYTSHGPSSWEMLFLLLGAALVFGIITLLIVEGTLIYNILLFLAGISIVGAGMLLILMPLMLLMEAAF